MSSKGKIFVQNFRDRVYGSDESALKKAYKGCNKDYTSVIKDIVTSLIADEDKGIKDYSEYFKIDYTGWTSTKHDAHDGIHIYEWTFDFAIEHENDNRDWTYELLKLSFIKAEVRIVIGYVDRERITNENELEIIKSQVQYFKNSVDANEEFYVILMNRTLSDKDPFGMRVYAIKEKVVEDITESFTTC